LRVQLPMGKTIRPGETVDFWFSFDEYPGLLDKRIEVQMLHEGICYFGEKKLVAGTENTEIS